jgi:hypothetical protein
VGAPFVARGGRPPGFVTVESRGNAVPLSSPPTRSTPST